MLQPTILVWLHKRAKPVAMHRHVLNPCDERMEMHGIVHSPVCFVMLLPVGLFDELSEIVFPQVSQNYCIRFSPSEQTRNESFVRSLEVERSSIF